MRMLEDLEEVVRYADDPSSRTDAAFVSALRFIRTHHATIRDMAARLEAAERDAELLALALHHAEKSTHAHGITFSIHFEPMLVSNGSLREYLEAMQEAGR